MRSPSSDDVSRESVINDGEREPSSSNRQTASYEGGAQTRSEDEIIYVDATKYVPIVANDPFHPGQLAKVLIDPEQIASVAEIGYGVLDNVRTPIVQLNYMDGQSEQVFDAHHVWTR